jgi:deazaflavin-dependent oxidoreductase (nitroreductase family)
VLAPGLRGEERFMKNAGAHYRRPGRLTRWIMNPFVLVMMRLGVSIWGSRILEVRGRKSGTPRRTPVNLLEVDDVQYLVSPRGEGEWVRNLRADGGRLALLLGRRREERVARELPDSEKSAILRAYLRKWKMEVGVFFDGVTADSDEEDVRRIASDHPVFRLSDGGR